MKRFERRDETVKALAALEGFLSQFGDGARISWLEIERATGVRTAAPPGRQRDEARGWVRAALKELQRAYLPLPDGLGIEFSSPDNSLAIASRRGKLVLGAIRGAHAQITRALTRHDADLDKRDRDLLAANRSVLGAAKSMVRGQNSANVLAHSEPSLPKLPRGK